MKKIQTQYLTSCIWIITYFIEKSQKVYIHFGYSDGECALEYITDSSLISQFSQF